MERRDVIRRQVDGVEADFLRALPDRVDVDVVLHDAVVPHLELRLLGLRVFRSRLGERRDPAGTEDARELGEHRAGIRRVMEGVEAEDPIDARVGKVDPPAVEEEEDRRRLDSDHRLAAEELARDVEGRGGDVEEDDLAADLREMAGRPPGAGAEIEDAEPRSELQSLNHRGKVDEKGGGVRGGAERLGEVVVPAREAGEVLFRFPIQLVERAAGDQLADVDAIGRGGRFRRGDRFRRRLPAEGPQELFPRETEERARVAEREGVEFHRRSRW